MKRLFSNGPSKDFVINPFKRLLRGSQHAFIAAPFVNKTDDLLAAAREGTRISLLAGLNAATSPEALKAIHGQANVAVRYLTRRFHAKIYIFDSGALIGSSNLTDGGLISNREATIWLDPEEDSDRIDEVQALFADIWESAQVLTTEKLKIFVAAHALIPRSRPDPDALVEDAVGKAEPVNINVASKTKTPERIFLEELRRQVYEQYRPAFNEVTALLQAHNLRRPELAVAGPANETNRFLHWVRLTFAPGDDAWEATPLRSPDERRTEIIRLGEEWMKSPNPKIDGHYIPWLRLVQSVFGTEDAIQAASKGRLTEGLLSIHAFLEQLRFVKGGEAALPDAFWSANNQDVAKVKRTLTYLVHGPGDFIQRLHDVLYAPSMKLSYIGRFCALELYGTIKPEDCPPINGRMAKALRYLGFDVRGG
jgi:hypothetical protein